MKNPEYETYFRASNYFGYLIHRLRSGGVWKTLTEIYKKLRKYTFISGIIKTFYLIMLLLEKSAILLLIVSSLILLMPLLLALLTIYVLLCLIKYARYNNEISAWIKNAEKITLYITSEKVFSGDKKLFFRSALQEAGEYSHPVIVLCSDHFLSLKWYGLNLLGVRSDYFFIIKKHLLSNTNANVTYIVLS